jgi:hypothetical protein
MWYWLTIILSFIYAVGFAMTLFVICIGGGGEDVGLADVVFWPWTWLRPWIAKRKV